MRAPVYLNLPGPLLETRMWNAVGITCLQRTNSYIKKPCEKKAGGVCGNWRANTAAPPLQPGVEGRGTGWRRDQLQWQIPYGSNRVLPFPVGTRASDSFMLGFLVSKMKRIITPISQFVVRITWSHKHKALSFCWAHNKHSLTLHICANYGDNEPRNTRVHLSSLQ